MTKSALDMTDEEWAAHKEEWLEKYHTEYMKWYTCKDCGVHCATHSRKTRAAAEKDQLEDYECLRCGSKNIEGNNIVQRFRNAVGLSRGGPAVGTYEVFDI